jgi:hypothetical protein
MSCWKDAGFGPRTYYSSGNLEEVVRSRRRGGPRAGLTEALLPFSPFTFHGEVGRHEGEGVGVAALVLVLVLSGDRNGGAVEDVQVVGNCSKIRSRCDPIHFKFDCSRTRVLFGTK